MSWLKRAVKWVIKHVRVNPKKKTISVKGSHDVGGGK